MSIEKLIDRESERIQSEFVEISSKYRTPSEVAYHREEIVKTFLRKYLPSSYNFGKGEIIDSNGVRSGEVDIVILGPYHPFTYDREKGRGLFLAEGILCYIEVKSDISNKKEIERGLRQIQRVKKLERKPTGGEMLYGTDYDEERLRRIPCILFAFRSPSGPTLKKNIEETLDKLKIPPSEAFDAIVMFEKGIIYNIKDPRDKLMVYVGKERRTGIVGVVHNKNTLMNFLVYLSRTIPWEIKMSPIILPYLKRFGKESVKVF